MNMMNVPWIVKQYRPTKFQFSYRIFVDPEINIGSRRKWPITDEENVIKSFNILLCKARWEYVPPWENIKLIFLHGRYQSLPSRRPVSATRWSPSVH